jgi:hypothetical protein
LFAPVNQNNNFGLIINQRLGFSLQKLPLLTRKWASRRVVYQQIFWKLWIARCVHYTEISVWNWSLCLNYFVQNNALLYFASRKQVQWNLFFQPQKDILDWTWQKTRFLFTIAACLSAIAIYYLKLSTLVVTVHSVAFCKISPYFFDWKGQRPLIADFSRFFWLEDDVLKKWCQCLVFFKRSIFIKQGKSAVQNIFFNQFLSRIFF